jgi:hypothetical protein
VKRCDDYLAKMDLWAQDPKVCATPGVAGVPRFGSKRFRSYEEMNAWKRELLLEIASRGGVTWTK